MAANILTVASTKGGAGKTTIIMALAGTLAAEGLRIAVVDADPNRAYSSWAAEAYEGVPVDVRAEADETRLADLLEVDGWTRFTGCLVASEQVVEIRTS